MNDSPFAENATHGHEWGLDLWYRQAELESREIAPRLTEMILKKLTQDRC